MVLILTAATHLQYPITHKQRDLYQAQAKQETGKVPLNLYGGKFYQAGEKKQQSIWKKERRGGGREKEKEVSMVLGRVSPGQLVQISNF